MAKQDDIKAIQDAIASAGFSWQPANNLFSSMTKEEQDKYLGYSPGPQDISLEEQERIGNENFSLFKASSIQSGFTASAIPAILDWRNKDGQNYVSPVKNQGSCGSCVAFGTATSVESRVKIQRGAGYAIDLSEAHLFYCIARSQGRNCGYNNDPKGGWWPEAAMIAFRDIGVTDEACYPYVAGDQDCTGRCADWASRVTKISGYTKVNTIATIKDWIVNNGPAEACFTVYQDFFSYSTGVYRKTSNVVRGGHCVCIVGYSDTEQCWICKNSWGTGFGEGGFFKIGYGECGIEGQVYGVNSVVDNYWITGKKVVGFWANNENRNAWVYISDFGWKKISPNNDNGFINILTELVAAKTVGATVNVYIENGLVQTVYVF
jgi:C1A family cysteine protease